MRNLRLQVKMLTTFRASIILTTSLRSSLVRLCSTLDQGLVSTHLLLQLELVKVAKSLGLTLQRVRSFMPTSEPKNVESLIGSALF